MKILGLDSSGLVASAAVCEDRPVPCHEFMKAAEGFDQLVTRPYMKMIGVGELNLTADRLEIRR